MTDEHKAALAEGRNKAAPSRRYLEALELHKPKRGRKRTPDSIEKRLAASRRRSPRADPLKRRPAHPGTDRPRDELATKDVNVDLSGFEDEFVGAAAEYSERKGISYAAWREVGVPPPCSSRAGITRVGASPCRRGRGQQRPQAATRRRLEPSSSSQARSGCGMRPTTLPASLQMPAMSSIDPFGLST